MKRILLILFCLAISMSMADAQTMDGLIFSGNVENMAMGDVAVSAPKLASRQLSIDAAYCKWAPKYTAQNEFSANAFIAAGNKIGITLLFKADLFPEYQIFDPQGAPMGIFKPKEMIAGAGISVRLSDTFFADATFKYASQKLADAEGNKGKAFCGDIAFSYSNNGFTAGVKVSNIGSKMRFSEDAAYSLPMNIQGGLSYAITASLKHRFLLSASAGYFIPKGYKAFTASGGVEYSFNNMVFIRGGYHFSADTSVIPSFASAGLGFRYKGMGVKGAYMIAKSDNPVKNSFLIGLSFDM